MEAGWKYGQRVAADQGTRHNGPEHLFPIDAFFAQYNYHADAARPLHAVSSVL